MADERRKYPREELVAAMICEYDANGVSTYCVVRNVSLDGALIECPLGDNPELFEIGDAVTLRDVVQGPKALFDGQTGEIAWVYKRSIGLYFEEPLKPSQEELRTWLEDQQLL